MAQTRKKVIIVQRRLTHYRVAFFNLLKKDLKARGIDLQLLIGEGTEDERNKKDSGEIPWSVKIPTRYFLKNSVCWQPVHKYVNGVDLVIITQENALLANHLMIFGPRKYRLAFWGHGANLQSQISNGPKERYKRWTTKMVDWWFAYTQLSADIVLATGFPAFRLTVVNNSIDTSEFRRQHKSVTKDEIQALKSLMGFSEGPLGVYIGSLYADKRLKFLFSAAESIRKSIGTFNLLVIGDGPQRHLAQSFCESHSWAYWAGTQHGSQKAVHIASADIILSPGAVGLGILDSFVSQLPLLTTDCKTHGPEIAYLENEYNGIMTSNNLDDYVNAAVSLLKNPDRLSSLQNGCANSAKLFSLETMVNNFANGISGALKDNQ